MFSTEHEEQLISGEVDIVVHSLKDLPTKLRDGLLLAAVPPRVDARDVLCGTPLDELPSGARVGTGSLRRKAQILSIRPDVEVVPIRGNVGPRLAKIDGEDGLDAVILAQAGLERLGMDSVRKEPLDPILFPYAVGQVRLACRRVPPTRSSWKCCFAIEDARRGPRSIANARCCMRWGPAAACRSASSRTGRRITSSSRGR